jgi:hypothetical protein
MAVILAGIALGIFAVADLAWMLRSSPADAD